MVRRYFVALLFCLVLATGIAQSATVDLLRSDSRLAARLTLHEPSITLRALLARVQADCKLELDADPDLRDETVCVCVQDRPCAEVLEQLASTLEFRWTSGPARPGAPAYRLTEEPGLKLRRSAQARQYRREASRELVTQLELLERFARTLRGLDRRGVRDELQRLETAVNELPVSAERFQAELEYRAAEQWAEPGSRPLPLAIAALPEGARARLVDGERLVMANRRPGALPLPDELLQALPQARKMQEGPAAPSQTEDEVVDFLCEVTWGELTVYVRARGLPGQPRRLIYALPSFLQTPSLVAFGPSQSDLRPGKVFADRPEDLERHVVFDWPGKKLQPDQPLSYFTGVTVAEVLGRLAITDPHWQVGGSMLLEGIPTVKAGSAPNGELPGALESAGAWLSRLGERSGAGTLTLGELLEPLAQRGGVDIRVNHSGWICFQSTRPFRARQRQIASELLREVFGPVLTRKAMTPEAAMAAGRLLSRAQLETLSAPYLGFPRHLTQNSGLRSAHDAWRLLDGLPAADREKLLKGAVVGYARLSEPGRAAVRRYIREVSTRPNGAPLDLELGPRDLPGLQFSLTPGMGSERVLELHAGNGQALIYTAGLEAEWSPSGEAPVEGVEAPAVAPPRTR